MTLLSRLQKCGGPDWGYRYTCRSPGCPGCRDRRIAAERRRTSKKLAGAKNSELAIVTVILDAVRNVEEIGPVVAKGGKDLRNMVTAQRRISGLWGPVEFLLYLETDAFDAQDYAHLGPDRRAQVAEFTSIFEGESGVVWVPSLHGIVRLGPALDVGQVREALERQWPGHRRVHIASFNQNCEVTTNVARIVNYSNKHRCTTDYYDAETGEITPREWDTSWLLAYYTWMHEWSRGFHRTRISVGPKKFKMPIVEQIEDAADLQVEIEPLPFIHGFSGFPTDYYYWRY